MSTLHSMHGQQSYEPAWVIVDKQRLDFVPVPIVSVDVLQEQRQLKQVWTILENQGTALCHVVAAAALVRPNTADKHLALQHHGPHSRKQFTYAHVDAMACLQEEQLSIRLQEYLANARPNLASTVPRIACPLLPPLPQYGETTQVLYDALVLADIESEAFALFDMFPNTNRLTPCWMAASVTSQRADVDHNQRVWDPIYIYRCGSQWGLLLPRDLSQSPDPPKLAHLFNLRLPLSSTPPRPLRVFVPSPRSPFHIQQSPKLTTPRHTCHRRLPFVPIDAPAMMPLPDTALAVVATVSTAAPAYTTAAAAAVAATFSNVSTTTNESFEMNDAAHMRD